ncbi:MAG TPA: bifunctional oligoribonuclease/PAP phosphatase NrnA [Sedimentisphaerales bacterium]|nr:bifunctional oligoribonuclease/PAP phosphatase NrnA [Sedimentisphaerales bacterium]HNU28982.1 bifunctional oligoribonuclease/PAP phosphatase NrnA [Sedimentisphaerales bacterium]
MSNEAYRRAAELIDGAEHILVTTHLRPDGDACGCVAAMTHVLRESGKTVRPLFVSPMPDWYGFLFDEKVPVLGEDVQTEDLVGGKLGPVDLVVILDTNSYSQLPGFDDYLRRVGTPVLVVDHHATSDGLGRVEITDPTAAAAGLVLLEFLKQLGRPITRTVAQALFVAIATDTGWFHLRNTDSRVFAACAELIDLGVDANDLYRKLYQTFSPARFRLMTVLLERVELHLDGRYASQYLLREDFERTGAAYRDTENMVNECQRIGSVQVAALFVELRDGRIRCSLRSRPDSQHCCGTDAPSAVDVSEIAAAFGGGGHRMAAGTYLPAPIEHAMQLIRDELVKRLG